MQKPSYRGFVMHKPSAKDFQQNCNEFWFEIYMSQNIFPGTTYGRKIARLGRQGMVEKDD